MSDFSELFGLNAQKDRITQRQHRGRPTEAWTVQVVLLHLPRPELRGDQRPHRGSVRPPSCRERTGTDAATAEGFSTVASGCEGATRMPSLDFCSTVHPEFVFDFPHRTMAPRTSKVWHAAKYDAAIAVPPGTGKTQMVMIDFAAWLSVHENPRRHIIELGEQRLTRSSVFGKRSREHCNIPDLPRLEFTKETESQFTIAGGDGRPSLPAAGLMGQVTGQRANFLLLVDDPPEEHHQEKAHSGDP